MNALDMAKAAIRSWGCEIIEEIEELDIPDNFEPTLKKSMQWKDPFTKEYRDMGIPQQKTRRILKIKGPDGHMLNHMAYPESISEVEAIHGHGCGVMETMAYELIRGVFWELHGQTVPELT
jgi:hypothetical protein